MSMKNSSDTIGNHTRDLPACSAVAEPTVQQPPNVELRWGNPLKSYCYRRSRKWMNIGEVDLQARDTLTVLKWLKIVKSGDRES
jgi:hypothetical protein